MQINNYEINVLVKGKPIREYYHNGESFIEGREGSNFEIEFINRTNKKVEAVLAVDGRSIIDGKEAGPTSSGYVVGPHQTIRIPGWKLNAEAVAAFVFSGKKNSYAAKMSGGSTRNTGVIGAMVFKEQEVKSYPIAYPQPAFPGYYTGSSTGYPASPFDFPRYYSGNDIHHGVNSTTTMCYGAVTASLSSQPTSLRAAAPISKGFAKSALRESTDSFNLGTGFGERTDFGTAEVSFKRGDLAAMMVVYYDDARGLRARGIEVGRRRERAVRTPTAFPGFENGCTPPVGWKG